MSALDYEEARSALEAYGTEGEPGNKTPPSDLLHRFLWLARDLRITDPQPIAIYGAVYLRRYRHSIPEDERWTVSEQVAIAALECGAIDFAQSIVREVSRKFPQSSRTKRLQGMFWEANGVPEKAADIYATQLRDCPSDEIMLKRQVALEKTKGNLSAAVDLLRHYLGIFAGDREGWEELGEMYLEMGMTKQALFCYEELLMFQPNSTQYLVRYADILYTMGGTNNLKIARSYYAKAVEASSGRETRALFGILQCAAGITDKTTLTDARSRAQIELPALAATALAKLVKAQESPAEKLKALEDLMKKQGLLPSA